MSKLRRFQTFPFRRKAALRAFSQRSGAKGESSEAQIVRLFVHWAGFLAQSAAYVGPFGLTLVSAVDVSLRLSEPHCQFDG